MTITARTALAGVAGWPVHHSLSPMLMNAWLAATSVDAVYTAFEVHPNRAHEAFAALPTLGIRGLNVTAPLKEVALAVAHSASPPAQAIGAANLLVVRDGVLHADNTDALGFLAACREAGFALNRGPVLVLGAGGAARAILHALDRAKIAEIRLTNRTAERASALKAELAPGAILADWSDRQGAAREAGVIINTARAHDGDDRLIDWRSLAGHPHVIDINYGEGLGQFLSGARAAGLQTLDGIAMLIGQARPSFEALFGRRAPSDVDAEALLRKALAA
ncbi:shikimate dehydrogenase family protein [Hyphobacterium marinum]|uniref:Shikimate dehydrogenase (NADP(+)) n=1 Tax=Hyphobacterium marinum TaxID=3116574 RepID=A0ABU7LUZ4_9PROT|nr:shikimate dehydrogenase [Hyphobacterium sp. Y6023]MEE2565378.1 shikimate dehydrogenase [Hyphobacterium sp. Y6023]